ncbi:MAG: formate C-acetyltransferase [Phycisphaeraceae bacterium JB051]
MFHSGRLAPKGNEPYENHPWRGFEPGDWQDEIDLRDFIQKNYTPYEGDESFLVAPTQASRTLWDKVSALMKLERDKGILDADTSVVGTITSHGPGYVDRDLEKIVGLQTDKPLKRAIMPAGGLRMVINGLKAYGYEIDERIVEIYTKYRKTHNDAVFSAYTDDMRAARSSHIITGLPDAYGRGRIIGDYRRVALYGVDRLIEERHRQKKMLEYNRIDAETTRLRENVADQIQALKDLIELGDVYGFDLRRPAVNAQEAIQWTYFAYLAAIKEQNGAAMSLGRVSTFLDIYIERDLAEGKITEEEAQEFIDHFVMKLRMVRFLRTPDYDALFSGDPVWVTEAIGGMGLDGRTLVSRTSYRFLHTLVNLGPAPEPNMTVLWSESLPRTFRKYCAKLSIETCAIQYESDSIMRPTFGDDYGIACCVSAMRIGKQMQFFGARANLAKALLYAINGGRDEISGKQIGPIFDPIDSNVLDFDEVWDRFDQVLDWVAMLYINTLNIIHRMHDKYAYEALQMSLHDVNVERTSATGIAGLSVVVDSLSAIMNAKVSVIRNEDGLAVDYKIEGDFPTYGNNHPQVDGLARRIVRKFMNKLRMHKTYRGSTPTMSILTITSNVVYGKATGATPDGRKQGEPFAPGANPMHGRDTKGAIASMSSVAQLPYEHARDGISYTFSIVPSALGANQEDRVDNLVGLLDGYIRQGGHHINVNVFDRQLLEDAMEHPEKYPQLTVRVSGYAVNFVRLTREQQLDVIQRTFHKSV